MQVLKGSEDVDYMNFFVLDENTIRRRYVLKLVKPRAGLGCTVLVRVFNCCNDLPVDIFECQSVNCFKYKLCICLSITSGL